MSELDDLIQYWRDNYSFNYLKRTPTTNNRILSTIKYLTELKKLHDIQRLTPAQSNYLKRG